MNFNGVLDVFWQENSLIHQVILSLFIITVIGEIGYWLRSRTQLQSTQGKIKELESFLKQYRQSQSQSKNYRIPRNTKNFRWFTQHLDGTWINDNFTAKIDHGDFILLQYPARLSRSASSSPFRFIPGILIGLGVLGTFYGIQEGLAAISEVRLDDNTSEVIESTFGLLGGMQIAFSTSLMGLGSSSVLTFVLFLSQVVRRQHLSQLRHRLDRIAFLQSPEHFLARLNFDSNADAAEALSEASQNIRKLSPEAIGSAVADSMKPTFENISSALVELRKEVSQDREELLRTLIQEQRVQLIEPILEELKQTSNLNQQTLNLIAESSQAVRELKDELAGVTTSLSGAIQTIQEFQQDTLQKLEEFAEGLQSILANFQTGTKEVFDDISVKLQEAIQSSIQGLDHQKTAFEASAQQAASTFKGIREELEQSLTTQGEQQRRLLSEFTTTMEETVGSQAQLITHVGEQATTVMEQASSNLKDTLGNIDVTLQQTRQTVQEELDKFRLEYQRGLVDFFEAQDTLLEETLGKQREGLVQVLEKTDAVFLNEYERRQELGQQVQEQIVQVETFISAMGLTSGERLAQLQEITETLGGEAEKIDKSYSNLVQRLNQSLAQSHEHLATELTKTRESNVRFFTEADAATAKLANRLLTAANYLVSASSTQKQY